MTPALSLQNVVKTYDGTEAVNGISFDIAKGEFFGFLGPNGAGKTTTINLITGLANLTGGTIEVFGKNVVTEYRETRRVIGLAAQEPNFDPFFPLDDVLIYQAGYHGIPRARAKQRAEQLLKRFDLWEHRQKNIRQISGGMKRRLLIAKALVHDPEILILDEPTAGVDVELRRDLWRFLRELNQEGKTILLTTHYIEEAEELCNRIGIIHNGQMKALEEKEVLMKKLAEKNVTLVTGGMPSEARAAVERLESVTVDNNRISFPTENLNTHLEGVTALLKQHGCEIVDIDVNAFDLEDIFVQLTDIQ